MKSVFTYSSRVYYDATDAGGVVYHSYYLNFIEHTRMEFWLHHGIDSLVLDKERHVSFLATNCEMQWKKPALLGDYLDITMEPIEIDRVSVLFKHDVFRVEKNGERTLLNTCQLRLVCVDTQRVKAITIPDDLREILSNG